MSQNVSRPAVGSRWSDSILLCRAFGHRWSKPVKKYERGVGYYVFIRICPSCGAQKTQWMSATTGTLLPGTVQYPEGYTVKGGVSPEERAQIRLEAVRLLGDQAR